MEALGGWMEELGVARSLSELGVKEEMIEGIAEATLVMEGGYHTLTRPEIVKILKESL